MRTLTALTALACAALPLAAQQPNRHAAMSHADSMHMKMHARMQARMHADSVRAAKVAPRDAASGMASGKKMEMSHDMDHDAAVAGGGTLPAGWSGRTDGAAPALANVKFVPMGEGMHLTLGPATILYHATDAVSGSFHTLATFTQTKAPTHPEGYGLFFAGRALGGIGQQYTYFLVRGDGKFLIKRRDGATTSVVKEWTDSPAVVKADAAGKATNLLEIGGNRDAAKVSFKINGQEVYSMDAKGADINGIVGLRANHNLDLHISGFAVHQM